MALTDIPLVVFVAAVGFLLAPTLGTLVSLPFRNRESRRRMMLRATAVAAGLFTGTAAYLLWRGPATGRTEDMDPVAALVEALVAGAHTRVALGLLIGGLACLGLTIRALRRH